MEETAKKRNVSSMLRPVLKKKQDILEILDERLSESSGRHVSPDQRVGPVERFWRALGSAGCRLGTWLRSTVTPLLERETTAWLRGLPRYASLLLQVVLWPLLGWLLSNVHLGLPCLLLVLTYWLYQGPLRRVLREALRDPHFSQTSQVSQWEQDLLLLGE